MSAPLVIFDPACSPLESKPASACYIVGAVGPKPIRTNLVGKFRVRLRHEDFPAVFVRTALGTRHFMVADFGDHWQLIHEHGANCRYDLKFPVS